jgi:hypothetical protein
MTRRLALARQGGTEQTTVARRLLSDLAQNRLGKVWASGADSRRNLQLVPSLPLTHTVGGSHDPVRALRPAWLDRRGRKTAAEWSALKFTPRG